MRVMLRLIAVTILLAVVGIVALPFLALQDTALVADDAGASVSDIRRARSLLAANDPRKGGSGDERVASLSGEDANLLLKLGATKVGSGAGRVQLGVGKADLEFTVEAPANPIGRWINLRATMHDAAGLPGLERVRVGAVPVPSFLVGALLARVGDRGVVGDGLALARNAVRGVVFTPSQATVRYAWSAETAREIRATVAPGSNTESLRDYSALLATIIASDRSGKPVPLVRLLPPLFARAAERGAAGDPAAENSAVLLTLTAYVTRHRLQALVGNQPDWPTPARRTVTLAGRDDYPKHFLLSALIAAEGNAGLSDIAGVTKELDDARGGSGFSFTDIAADRAGTRFGRLAVDDAAALQARVTAALQERDFMPVVADLPEFMPDAVFRERFGGVGEPKYVAMMEKIEARIAALPMYR